MKNEILKTFEGKDFLTTKETQSYLGVSRSGLHTLFTKGKIKKYTLDGLDRVMYKKSELLQLFKPKND